MKVSSPFWKQLNFGPLAFTSPLSGGKDNPVGTDGNSAVIPSQGATTQACLIPVSNGIGSAMVLSLCGRCRMTVVLKKSQIWEDPPHFLSVMELNIFLWGHKRSCIVVSTSPTFSLGFVLRWRSWPWACKWWEFTELFGHREEAAVEDCCTGHSLQTAGRRLWNFCSYILFLENDHDLNVLEIWLNRKLRMPAALFCL